MDPFSINKRINTEYLLAKKSFGLTISDANFVHNDTFPTQIYEKIEDKLDA